MHPQQSEDQFQTQHDQLLTYSFSTNMQSLTAKQNHRPKKKVDEKLTLNIIQPLKSIKQNQDGNSLNKFKKQKMHRNNDGKVIKIGEALFSSNFQCGSLGSVEQLKGQNTYLIKMDKQVNSNRPSAWFYFKCEGLKGEVNFIVSGFTKTTSLYSEGMKICYRQIKKQQPHENYHLQTLNHHKSDWHRGGTRISYVEDHDIQNQQHIFSLKFSFNFHKNFDTDSYPPIEFAYSYPYEYKRIILLAKSISKKDAVVQQSLGKTYEGRDIPLLTIGNPSASRSIVLSARVHPGQTVSSFIMEGFLKQLISNSEFSRSLKQKYLFKIVPMINPDGVVRGNYRFSAAGYDLNRRWKHCYQSSHPEVYYLKNMIKKLNKQKKVLMYIDIHGHSRKKSAFFYGCCAPKDYYLGQLYDQDAMSKPKQFPFLMTKLNQNFKYQFCAFNMSKDKEGTARIQMWKQLHIDHVYTLQSSFFGSADGGHNYTEEDFIKMGKSLLEGISVYFYDKKQSSRQTTAMCQSTENPLLKQSKQEKSSVFEKFINILNEAKQELKNSPQLLNAGMNSDSGSDSEPEAGIIPEEQRQMKSANLNQKTQVEHYRSQFDELMLQQKSPANLKNSKSIKITVRQPTRKNARLTSEQLKNIVDEKLQNLKNREYQKSMFQKEIIAMTVNNFYSQNSQQLDSLTTQALLKKNDRVHSKQVNQRNLLLKQKKQRLNSENPISNNIDLGKEVIQNDEEDQKRKIQIMTRNLLKTREGVQYRRVKKLAEEMKKKHVNNFSASSYEDTPVPIVRGIVTVNNQLHLQKKRIKSIAPSFYPQSQKNKRFSVEMAYRNNSNKSGKIPFEIANKKFFINGDDINVHCKGHKIYL